MGAIASVVWESIHSPVTTSLVIIACWIWVKFFVQDWDPRHFTASYVDVAQKNQYWRVFLAPLSHTSPLLLLINATLMWNLRVIELEYGPFFVLRYTVLVMATEALIANLCIYFITRLTSNQEIRQAITGATVMGSSSLVLSWLAFRSVTFVDNPKYLMLFGLFNVHPATGPLVALIIYYFLLPVGYSYSNFGAMTSGYLLAAGVLQILPGFFWSLCFLVDVALIVAVSVLFRESGIAATAPPEEVQTGDVLDVVEVGPANIAGGINDLRDLFGRGRDSPETHPTRSQIQQDVGRTADEQMEEGEFYGDENTPLLTANTPAVLGGSGSRVSLLDAEHSAGGEGVGSYVGMRGLSSRRSGAGLITDSGDNAV